MRWTHASPIRRQEVSAQRDRCRRHLRRSVARTRRQRADRTCRPPGAWLTVPRPRGPPCEPCSGRRRATGTRSIRVSRPSRFSRVCPAERGSCNSSPPPAGGSPSRGDASGGPVNSSSRPLWCAATEDPGRTEPCRRRWTWRASAIRDRRWPALPSVWTSWPSEPGGRRRSADPAPGTAHR